MTEFIPQTPAASKAHEWKQIGDAIVSHSPAEIADHIRQDLWSKKIGVAPDQERYRDYQEAVNIMAHPNMTAKLANQVSEAYKKENGVSLSLEFEALPWLTESQKEVAASKIKPDKI